MTRRAYIWLICGLAIIAASRLYIMRDQSGPEVQTADSIPSAERRLEAVRRIAATVPGKAELYRKAAADLAVREKSLIRAENGQQAEVNLLELIQNIAHANQIDIRGHQGFHHNPINNDYGEVTVTVAFTCGMEQLLNFLTAIGNQPEILSTSDIQLSGGSDKKKNVLVRLTVGAAVPRKIIQEKKGAGF